LHENYVEQPACAGASEGDAIPIAERQEAVIINGVEVAVDDGPAGYPAFEGDDVVARFAPDDLLYGASYGEDLVQIEAVGQGLVAVEGGGQVGRVEVTVCFCNGRAGGMGTAKKAGGHRSGQQ